MSQGARNRAAGKLWERYLRDGFRAENLDTEHHRDTGAKDEGDLIVRSRSGKHRFVVEAKNATLNVTGFLQEASNEKANFLETRPYVDAEEAHAVVAWKRKGKTFKGGVVMMEMDEFIALMNLL